MKRAVSLILATLVLLTLAACAAVVDRTGQESAIPSPTGKSSTEPENTPSTPSENGTEPVNTPDEGGAEPENTPVGDEADGYQLPAGAASVYGLYETVVDFLNHGFHYDDLRDVYDVNLTLAFYSKWTEKPEDNFTLGMNYDETCSLIARIMDKASAMDPPFIGGHFVSSLTDFDAFQSLFPESMQTQIDENYSAFVSFIADCVYCEYYGFYRDGENPFGSNQTEWEKLGENELEIKAYHSNDWDEDLYVNFPQAYEIYLGKYDGRESAFGGVFDMRIYYVQIGVRYYFLGFHATIT